MSNCISFMLEEVPYIQQQSTLKMSDTSRKQIESDFNDVKKELDMHRKGIQEKLKELKGGNS